MTGTIHVITEDIITTVIDTGVTMDTTHGLGAINVLMEP